MSVNVCSISGNLGADPELRRTAGGTSVLHLSLAVNERVRDASGGWMQDDQRRSRVEVIVDELEFLSAPCGMGDQGARVPQGDQGLADDDLPF